MVGLKRLYLLTLFHIIHIQTHIYKINVSIFVYIFSAMTQFIVFSLGQSLHMTYRYVTYTHTQTYKSVRWTWLTSRPANRRSREFFNTKPLSRRTLYSSIHTTLMTITQPFAHCDIIHIHTYTYIIYIYMSFTFIPSRCVHICIICEQVSLKLHNDACHLPKLVGAGYLCLNYPRG